MSILRNCFYRVEEILTRTSCARNSRTVILHKWAPDTDIPTHLAQGILIHCTSDPTTTRSWRRDPEREILNKRPAHRDLAQVALEAA